MGLCLWSSATNPYSATTGDSIACRNDLKQAQMRIIAVDLSAESMSVVRKM
jgi:hypothetical protein